jgi:hypothetical protein
MSKPYNDAAGRPEPEVRLVEAIEVAPESDSSDFLPPSRSHCLELAGGDGLESRRRRREKLESR